MNGSEKFDVLRAHFFRRFFDNDSLSMDGDTQTAVVRALSIFAVPGLMVAFFLINSYPIKPPRPLWGAIGDDYYFVTYAFVAMGAIAIFEWEMLFADRLDFIILLPLPLRPWQLLAAKMEALGRFLGLFLVSVNVFSTLILPLIARRGWPGHVLAHATAGLMAGSFGALMVLAVGGLLLCHLPTAAFRAVSRAVQLTGVAVLTWLLLAVPMFAGSMRALMNAPPEWMRWMPPFWYLGVEEKILLGDAAPAFAGPMAREGVWALVIVLTITAVTYPLAWRRKQKMALEGALGRGWRLGLLDRLVAWAGARRPEARAMFGFIGQTLRRNQRYQTYLTMYGGVGLAIAGACVVTMQLRTGRVVVGLSDAGLHALIPMLLFWLIVGLRTAFAFPVDMGARWVFATSGVELGGCAAAARRWVILQGLALGAVILILLRAAHWDARKLAVQAVVGVCLTYVLADGFFAFRRGVPFTRPRMPGRSSLPMVVFLYAGFFPYFVMGMIDGEIALERKLWRLWIPIAVAVGLRLTLREMERREGLLYEVIEEEIEGTLKLGITDG